MSSAYKSVDNFQGRKHFYQMLKIRLAEEALAKEYKHQQMRCPMHLSIGQEAVAVGVCANLRKEDAIMSTHRAHAHFLAKGGDLRSMIAEIYGKSTGCCGGLGGSMHLVDLSVNMLGCTPIVGGTLPLSVGVAFANHLEGSDAITTCFFGEGMTEEGVFAESLNFAALHSLPILFVCENNLYSVYSPLSVRQSNKRSILKLAEAHGIEVDSGDGNNVEDVHNKTASALAHIKEGKGPYLLEFSTYRYKEHCGPNDDLDLGYRTEGEFNYWQEKCPINSYKKKLFQNKFLTDSVYDEMVSEITSEIEKAFAFAKKSPFPISSIDDLPLYAP